MPVGVPETEVFAAADRVLARGERPTVERVRKELGHGSPARVGQLLETWWTELARRLAGHSVLPSLPETVASAFTQVWEQAAVAGRSAAEDDLNHSRSALDQERQALRDQAQERDAALEHARGLLDAAQSQTGMAEQRLADLQYALTQAHQGHEEVRMQRDALQVRADQLDARISLAHREITGHLASAQVERAKWMSQIQALEDRASTEIDRARHESKILTAQAKKAASEHAEREHVLQVALQEAQTKVAELRGQVLALSNVAPSARRAKGKAGMRKAKP